MSSGDEVHGLVDDEDVLRDVDVAPAETADGAAEPAVPREERYTSSQMVLDRVMAARNPSGLSAREMQRCADQRQRDKELAWGEDGRCAVDFDPLEVVGFDPWLDPV